MMKGTASENKEQTQNKKGGAIMKDKANENKANGDAVVILTRQGARYLAGRAKKSGMAYDDAYIEIYDEVKRKGGAFGLSLDNIYGFWRPEVLDERMVANFSALAQYLQARKSPNETMGAEFSISGAALVHYQHIAGFRGPLSGANESFYGMFPDCPVGGSGKCLALVFVWCGCGADGSGLYRFVYEVIKQKAVKKQSGER